MSDFFSFKSIDEIVGRVSRYIGKKKDTIESVSRAFGNVQNIQKYYVQPNCQHHNPADFDERQHRSYSIQVPVFEFLENFLRTDFLEKDGRSQLFVLADAGMGKTSLLVMVWLTYFKNLWPTLIKCELLKLGADSLRKIEEIHNQHKTVLLLDALDEDQIALSDVDGRIADLLKATQDFKAVIITCRTQFFPKSGPDPFDITGRIRIGTYICPTIFLSLFDDKMVEKYLNKRFLKQPNKIESSKRILGKTNSLRFRPLLLSYVEELISSEERVEKWTKYNVFKSLVDAWLLRECRKSLFINKNHSFESLLDCCIQLAVLMQEEELRTISLEKIDAYISENILMSNILSMDIGGRSLLNRNSEQEYRFSHYSIQEFLIARGSERAVNFQRDNKELRVTDEVYSFMKSMGIDKQKYVNLSYQNITLRNEDFGKSFFVGSSFPNGTLENVSFEHSNLSGADFSGAVLTKCSFANANLERSNFSNASVQHTDFVGAKMRGSIFYEADLEGSRFTKAQLQLMRFRNTKGQWIESS